MSKTCEVCKRSYSDQLAACPHCAEVVELSEDDVVGVVEDASDSAVDLGLPAVSSDPHAGGQASGGSSLSFVEWASLVEEKSEPPAPAASKLPPASPPTRAISAGMAPGGAGPGRGQGGECVGGRFSGRSLDLLRRFCRVVLWQAADAGPAASSRRRQRFRAGFAGAE